MLDDSESSQTDWAITFCYLSSGVDCVVFMSVVKHNDVRINDISSLEEEVQESGPGKQTGVFLSCFLRGFLLFPF